MTAPQLIPETRDVPMLDVRAQPGTFDEENRTVEFIAATGARGLRRKMWGDEYYEELDMAESSIRMDRLNNGAPFLNSHNSWDVSDVIGAVERAWVENGALMIRVKFSRRPEVETILQDIKDGVLRHVSVGYFVHQYDITEQSGSLDVYRAMDWEPAEVSLVPIGFDDAAVARKAERSTQATFHMAHGVESKEVDMTTESQQEAPVENTAATEERSVDLNAVAQEAVQKERTRVAEIRKAVRMARLGDEFADSLIESDDSLDAARAKIITEIGKQDTSEETSTVRASVDHDMVTDMRSAAAEAILHRGGVEQKVSEGNPFAGMSLLRLSEDLLSRQGVNVRGMSQREIATRALSTSDLANIAGAVFNKTLLAGYESAPRTFVGVFRQATANDFRAINRVRLSGAPSLEEVKENGEFKHGKVSDEKETYSLATYGKILPFTRQTIINDDMDALTRVPMMFGRAAADLESDIVWAIVVDNDALSDGTALFAADHGNLAGSGGNISVATVGAARAAMRAQTGMEGRVINVMPRHLIVGADAETELDQFLTSITPATTSNAVPTSMQRLNPVVEPRLTGNAWYIAADFNQVDTIEYCYLDGNSGVYIETREGFNVDGIEIKARHDFAAKAIDYRGLYKNGGA